MGLTVGLVKKAFSKTKSFGNVRNGNERNGNCIEKATWKLRKLTFCGDYPDPLLQEEDEEEDAGEEVCGNGSVDSFGPTQVDARNSLTTETATEEFHQDTTAPIQNSEEKESAAALIIQSSFRGFLMRNRRKLLVRSSQMMSPGGRSSSTGEESMSASPKIQAGGEGGEGGDHSPVKPLMSQHKVRHNKQQKTQILSHVKEWDDSTLSSNMSKLRIQNKLEATTRRERALAYAFSQQLRSSSSKKRATNEANLGWSLLERWMATRLPENSSVEDYMEKKNADKRKPNTVMFKKHVFDATTAEEESCASNDVPLESTENNTLTAKTRGKQNKGKEGSCS